MEKTDITAENNNIVASRDYEKILDIISGGESVSLEFKKTTGQLERGMESLCAMLNGNGGTLMFGISDEGKIIGQDVSDTTKRDIASSLRAFEPFPLLDIEYINIPNTKKQVIKISTSNTDDKPYVYKGRPYMRVESTTVVMPQKQYHNMLDNNYYATTQWEQRINPSLSISNLDEEEINRTIRIGVETGRLPEAAYKSDIPTVLTNMELMQDGKLTNAAAVLYLKHEMKEYPQLLLRLARFQGTDNRIYLDNKQVHGNIFHMLEEAMTFLFRHLDLSGEVKDLYREEKLAVPRIALRECIVNALIHREYKTPGGSVGIAIYDDRIEIINFGQIPKEIDYTNKNPQMLSKPNNPIIARAFFYRGIFENWGRGIGLIKNECRHASLPEPEFVSANGFVIVTFRLKKSYDKLSINNNGELNGGLNGELNGGLNKPQQMVYEYIRIHEGCTGSKIAAALNIPYRTLEKHIAVLSNNGLIEHRGSKKTGGYYSVKKD